MPNLELLPCPFCGEQPKVLQGMRTIMCVGEECFGPATTASGLEDASVQWNKRALSPPEPTEGQVEAGAECAYLNNRAGSIPWAYISERHKQEWREKVKSVLAAALRAMPLQDGAKP